MSVRPRAAVVVDGEHYPPVVRAALERLATDYDVVAGLFAGGREKLRGGVGVEELAAGLGVPSLAMVDPRGRPAEVVAVVADVLHGSGAEVVLDLSDEPVLGYRERFLLMSAALAAGASYRGAGFSLEAPPRLTVARPAALNVIGTGKRVGKTAVSGHLARLADHRWRDEGGVVVVAMGRGGPAEPEPVPGRDDLDAADLLRTSRAGGHAASDCYEDAVLARVPTIGCRRCGGGLAGEAYDTNLADALPLVEASGAALAVFEGSGAVMPPVAAHATLCVAGAAQPAEYITGYLGTYRLLLSDVLILTMCEEPFASPADVVALIDAAEAIAPELDVVPTVFRPAPAKPIAGQRVAFFTTAPEGALPSVTEALRAEHGADVVLASPYLADRGRLAADLRHAAEAADVFLTEIKAAAIDAVAEAADAAGVELVFCDNTARPLDVTALRAGRVEPAAAAVLDDRLIALAELARARYTAEVRA